MKVSLISPYYSVTAYGLRVLSGVLRARGHATQMIFLPHRRPGTAEDFLSPYPESVLDDVAAACADSDVVGVSLMSNYMDRAVAITRKVRGRCGARIVWGGIHATVSPEECLEHADFICISEGEQALPELLDRLAAGVESPVVQGIWSKVDGCIRRTAPCPLVQDLDALPLPDYELANHLVLHEGRLRPFTPDLLRHLHSEQMEMPSGTERITGIRDHRPALYQTLGSRGCPFSCTYCCNDVFKRQNPGQRILRFRSPESIVEEIRAIRERFPFFEMVLFSDDSLVTMKEDPFLRLARLYRERVGLPFICLATPNHCTEPKVRAFVEAGMVKIKIGIQSGSRRILDLYRRHVTNEQILKAAHVVARFRDRLVVDYDVILDCPWETTRNKLETLDLVLDLPRPFNLIMYSLTLYPGTHLFEQALKERLGQRNMYDSASFYIRRPTYINMLFYMVNRRWPAAVVRFLRGPLFVALFHRRWFELVFGGMIRARRISRRLLSRLLPRRRGAAGPPTVRTRGRS